MTGRLRVGVIGAGWWASIAHLPSLAANPRVELAAVADPTPGRADAAAERFGIPLRFSDVGRFFRESAVDAVVIATPHTTHFPLVSTALANGIHVLVEKPMVTTARDAWALVDQAESTDRVLAVGLTYQYAPAAWRVQEAVQHEIGELVSVNAEFSSNTYGLFSTTDPAKANLDDPTLPHGTTYSDPALSGGGQGHTQLTHLLGGLLWAAGDQATEVAAFMDNRGVPVDVVDALAFRLRGGALCTASSTGTTPAGAPVRHQIRFHGTAGVVEWDMLAAEAWIYREGGSIEHVENPGDRPAYAREEVSRMFAEVVLDGAPNRAPAISAAASVALIEGAYLAADVRQTVQVMQGAFAERMS